jgi:hypothetical protein
VTLGRSLARSGLLALAIGVATAIVPSAPLAHHAKAVRICEKGDPQHDFYQYWDSSPILIRGAGGRRVGRIAIATPAIGLPDWRYCAVAIKKRHKRKRRMAVTIGFSDAPGVHARDRGRYRRFAGPVYLRGTYRDDGDRYIEVRGRIGKLGLGIHLLRPPR